MVKDEFRDTLPNSTWTTDPLFMKIQDEYYFYQNDHLGTPQKMIAGNGEVVWSAKYNSFGEASIEVETVENNLRFPGQIFDNETGLHYNWNRYYDPMLGRYLRVDPSHSMQPKRLLIPYLVLYMLNRPQELNNFSYTINSPINRVDIKGLMSKLPKWLKDPNDIKNSVECVLALKKQGEMCEGEWKGYQHILFTKRAKCESEVSNCLVNPNGCICNEVPPEILLDPNSIHNWCRDNTNVPEFEFSSECQEANNEVIRNCGSLLLPF